MFLKFYHHLCPLSKVENSFAYKSDENNNLDIFEMVTNTNEHVKEFLNKKLLIFWIHQMDAKNFKCVWSGGGNMNPCFELLIF